MREQLVFPGHPIHLALQIMDAFPSLEAALALTEWHWHAALSCQKVDGTGGAVYMALEALKEADKGTPEAAFEIAQDMWITARSSGDFIQNMDEGVAQGERLHEEFLTVASKWGKA